MAYRITRAVALVFLSLFPGVGHAADPSNSGTAASGIESLTAQVRGLLAQPAASYPDPWKPGRERPKQFFVLPGEKLSYAERLTAMGLAGLANRGGPRLFVRGHFDFNADADRFWLSRLSHSTGTAVDDPEAYAGQAWQAVPAKQRTETHLAWGPYEELPPGRYAVAFRLKSEGQGEAPVARLDVFNFWLSQEGKDGTYAQRTLRSKDFAHPGRYADFWLDFEHVRTGKVEYRVWWPGNSPLSLDRVVVFRKP